MKRIFLSVIFLLSFVFSAFSVDRDSISVYIFLSETCPICKNQTLTLNKIYQEFSSKGISFTGLFPNQSSSTNETIQEFKGKYKIAFLLKKDDDQKITKQLSATITPQVFVIRNKTKEILYKGKVDNSFETIGKKRQVITANYLKDVLNQVTENKSITIKETQPVGCFISKK